MQPRFRLLCFIIKYRSWRCSFRNYQKVANRNWYLILCSLIRTVHHWSIYRRAVRRKANFITVGRRKASFARKKPWYGHSLGLFRAILAFLRLALLSWLFFVPCDDMSKSIEICDETRKHDFKIFFRAHLRAQVFLVVYIVYIKEIRG